MAELQIASHVVEGVALVSLQGDLDSYSAPRLRHLLDGLAESDRPAVLLDLAYLEYIDSVGLGVLVASLKRLSDCSGALALVSVPPPVANVLRVTGLERMFPVFTDGEAAQASLRADRV